MRVLEAVFVVEFVGTFRSSSDFCPLLTTCHLSSSLTRHQQHGHSQGSQIRSGCTVCKNTQNAADICSFSQRRISGRRMEAEEGIRSVVLRRTEAGLGFSIMGGAGYDFPPVIYGIERDSPAGLSGALEAGDVILSINEREVVKMSTKEVLRTLRLSGDIVHIKFKRDPGVVAKVRHFLSIPHHQNHSPQRSPIRGNKSPQAPPSFADELFINPGFKGENEKQGQKNGRRNQFETFVMTGEAILNLSSADSNHDVMKGSPIKGSKLTPLPMTIPHLPVLVERDKEAERRRVVHEGAKPASNKPKQEESGGSPPLPLPPPPQPILQEEVNSNSAKGSSNSESFPPPPPEEEEEEPAEAWRVTLNGNGTNGNNNNNEDTSISSSVMSEDGVEELEENGKEEEPDLDPDTPDTAALISGGGKGKKGGDERERYNEYILLNGSRATLNSSEAEEASGRHVVNKTPSTITPGQLEGTSSEEGESDHSSSSEHSERDQFGGTYDRLGLASNNSGGTDSDSSDVESMRVAPVTKAVDVPSAERLAKRLFALDGFKATDVWRHLSKNTDFNRVVATEYLNFFNFQEETLDVSLRKFLGVCPLRGETQDRERVLCYFSSRYVDSNPDTFGSQDSVHTLACALMLLNTDIYSGLRAQRMTCSEFIENLSGLNDGGDFPREVLKQLYVSIRTQPLVSPLDDDEDSNKEVLPIDTPPGNQDAIEYKRGYLVRKCTHEFGGKKTPFGKRGWKMYFCRLQELILLLSSDESPTPPPAFQIKLHHAFASVASDYRKRKNVFRLILADRSQFMFQASEGREMHSWIDHINWVAARFSSPALEAPVSSSGRFERPLLPSSSSKVGKREQISSHQAALSQHEKDMEKLTQPKKKNASSSLKKEEKEKLIFYQYEMKRYRSYVEVLEKRHNMDHAEHELVELQVLPNPPVLMEEES